MKSCIPALQRSLALVVVATALGSYSARASHFRFGNLSWAPTPNQGSVEFRLTIALRRDETNNYGGPFNAGVDAYAETGDIIYDGISNTAFNFGDGTAPTPRLNFLVTAFRTNENWLLAEALDPLTGLRGIRHSYASAGTNIAAVNSCCRLGPLLLNNRADGNITLRSLVRPYSGNRSPVSTLVPIITVPVGPAVTFTVPAVDPDQDFLTFRLANDATLEAGPCCVPPNLSINSSSGVMTWNNVGLNTNKFWTVQVVVEDRDGPGGVKSSSPVDFLLQISGNSVPPPTCAISPSNTIIVTPGTLVSFTVSGTGYFGQAGGTGTNRITLNTGGLPAGAIMTPTLPVSGGARQGVMSTFTWTPGQFQGGTYPILFTITDEYGGQSLCSINVIVQPVSDLSIQKLANPSVVMAGSSVTYTLRVDNFGPNHAQSVTVTDFLPAGLSNVAVVTSQGSCFVSNSVVTCVLGGLSVPAAGNDLSAEVTITAVVVAGGTLTNSANVTSSSMDPNPSNNTSTAVVTVTTTNLPPLVAITQPADGAVFTTPPGLVPIEASASDPDGFVQRVDFYVDGAFLGADSNAPFALTLTTNVPGLYTLTAIATDNREATGTSAPVRITVIDTNAPPIVAITYPSDGAVFTTPPGLVPIEASAHDPDGFVQRVDFYVDGAFHGADSNAPFALTLITNVPGLYTLTAIATDNRDDTGTSAPVHVTIQPCDPNLNVAPIPNQTRCLCDEVTFTAVATSPDPVTYVWQHNGVILPGENNASLVLKNLKPAQAGVYTAVISTPCLTATRSALLTLKGAGNQNPVSFTNTARITIFDANSASPYPAPLLVECLPGPVRHLAITLEGLSHNYPDDIDLLLASPAGAAVRLLSDAGGGDNITNLVLTFTDTATNRVSNHTNILSGLYAPTDYDLPLDPFPLPAPQSVTTTNFAPFLGTEANGTWRLFIRDDLGGDGGIISNGWTISIEWEDTPPRLADPQVLADGSFRATLHGLPRMTHVVEASFDLATWEPVSTNTFTTPLVLTLEPSPGGPPWRFLRAVRCP